MDTDRQKQIHDIVQELQITLSHMRDKFRVVEGKTDFDDQLLWAMFGQLRGIQRSLNDIL